MTVGNICTGCFLSRTEKRLHDMQPVPAGYPIERLTGPIIVGYLLHWGLFGTLSVQLYLYYLAFPKDKKLTKYLVYVIYVVEFVQTVFVTQDAFAMFGYGFGDLEALTRMDFNWLVVPVMGGVVACVGQIFYAYRIFVLSRSRTVPAFVTCVSLTSSVAALITGVYTFEDNDITKLNNTKTSIALGIWCGGSALCDVVIAICMAYYLTHRNPSFRQTRILVANLIRLTIETGSVTAVVALLSLVLFFVFPHQTFYGPPIFILPKLYANTVYMVLNSRIRIVGGRDTYASSNDMELTTTLMMDTTPHPTQGTQRTDGVQGQVLVVAITKEVFSDDHEMSRISDKPQDESYTA
ncbi:hypothetical protein ARMGADRAFT_1017212 [Armillaria gallica]|uniref:DUF6534 domain-containing protein n=1 Tax=Armillaria gallica TaxID=47427 RepID=A0A2H3CTX4_ARMGA|nr:hypothetical protein ARMGADRAFT_1017212 [Armillaria gallica]